MVTEMTPDEAVLEQIRTFEMKDDETDYAALLALIARIEGMAELRNATSVYEPVED
jgi:hypothetical protein